MANVSAESEKSRAEVAEYLREFADELHPREGQQTDDRHEGSPIDGDRSGTGDSRASDGRKVTVIVGNESATLNPPETLSFGVDVDSEDSLLGGPTGERGVTFSLSWSSEDVETEAGDEFDVE
jgi:hypothetical protein